MRSVRQNQYRLLKGTDPTNPTREEKRKQMLESGKWREGESGELIRVNQPVGLPSDERIKELEMMDRPLTESEAREYASAAFDPSSSMNVLFGLAAGLGFDPVGEAAMGLIGSGAKAVGKGVRAMKGGSSPFGPGSKYAPGGDPNRAMKLGQLFVRDFYSDPFIQNHFKKIYGEGEDVMSTFSRGQNPIEPITDVDTRRKYGGAVGVFDNRADKIYLDNTYFGDYGQKMSGLEPKVKSITAHETAHYADAPMWKQDSQLFGAGSQLKDNLLDVSNSNPTDYFIARSVLPEDQARRYWSYISDPVEMTANAMEARLAMEKAIFENPDPRLTELFGSIGDDDSFSKLMVGDFSDLNDLQFKMLMGEVYNNVSGHAKSTMHHVLKGANDRTMSDYAMGKIWNNPEKKKSISDWLKYALMIPVAGTAAASQAEMIDGGKLKLLKKK